MGDMDAIVAEFVEEGKEKADLVEHHLIDLEKKSHFAGTPCRGFPRFAQHQRRD